MGFKAMLPRHAASGGRRGWETRNALPGIVALSYSVDPARQWQACSPTPSPECPILKVGPDDDLSSLTGEKIQAGEFKPPTGQYRVLVTRCGESGLRRTGICQRQCVR